MDGCTCNFWCAFFSTWIGDFDVESVPNENVSCGEIAMNESMLCQKVLYRELIIIL